MFRMFVLSACLALASGAALADDLIQRDLQAFLAFSQVRGVAVEEAIQRRDRDSAKSLATRLQQEECRFLERVARHLKEKRSPVAADLAAFLASYRELPLGETVRMRRLAESGSRVHELALAALGAPPSARNLGGKGLAAAPRAPVSTAQAPAIQTPLRRAYSAPRVLADVADDFDRPRRSGGRTAFPSTGSGDLPASTPVAIEDTALASSIRVPKK